MKQDTQNETTPAGTEAELNYRYDADEFIQLPVGLASQTAPVVAFKLSVPLNSTNVMGQSQTACFEIRGTPAEVLDAITQMFDADRANDLRHDLGLNVTSESAVSGRQ